MEGYREPSRKHDDIRRSQWCLAVDGATQGINNTAKETGTNGDVNNLAGMFNGIAFLDETVATKDGDTNTDRGFWWRMLEAVQTQEMKCALARDGMRCGRCEREKAGWLDRARELSGK